MAERENENGGSLAGDRAANRSNERDGADSKLATLRPPEESLGDAAWFRANPGRRYRVRSPFRGERLPTLGPDAVPAFATRLVVAVKRGSLRRAWLATSPESLPPETINTERVARSLFEAGAGTVVAVRERRP
jgi:hypothetical protein